MKFLFSRSHFIVKRSSTSTIFRGTELRTPSTDITTTAHTPTHRAATYTPLPIVWEESRDRYALKMHFCYFLKRVEIHSASLYCGPITREENRYCLLAVCLSRVFNLTFFREISESSQALPASPSIPQSDFLKK